VVRNDHAGHAHLAHAQGLRLGKVVLQHYAVGHHPCTLQCAQACGKGCTVGHHFLAPSAGFPDRFDAHGSEREQRFASGLCIGQRMR
jgi:hypothetical protein